MNTTLLDQIIAITEVSAKHWQPFDATSPGGIPFAGYLCRQESDKLGMLAVTRLGGQERLEFIPAMPKIHYPYIQDREGRLQVSIPVPINIVDARFTVKLDGTAIIFYPLTDAQGQVLEVVARTRLLPMLMPSRWGDWLGLLADVLPNRGPVEAAVREQHVVLVFELWGYRNPHLVRYEQPLALTLHTAIRHRKPVSHQRLADIAQRYGLALAPTLEAAAPDAAGLAVAYRRWQARLETENQAAGQDVFVQEGAILVLSTVETATYWKCKPPSIEEIHWQAGQHISKEIVRQALLKLLENGYDFAAGRVEDLQAALEGDFDPQQVAAEIEMINRTYLDFVIEIQRQAWLRSLVDSSGLNPHDLPALMRHLAPHYPRKEMGWVYATVKTLYGAG
ncbi:MAG: hypothetical protein IPO15_06335 [Anaerolineae bacterium]|uniref:hypothetical protein n=1 Tax=Candidatus Amarolinea dominans TaxID=3140696 RepID=UPI003137038D|nr:hypothetical protein [Anaerolineae bacterium]